MLLLIMVAALGLTPSPLTFKALHGLAPNHSENLLRHWALV